MSSTTEKETRGFETEVKQLLDLMIHSLYSNKEIFLRELISNASDACDKLRFEALTNDALYEGEGDLEIHVDYDKEARTVSVRDNGVGMGHQEVVENLGTIAKSGTRQFFEALTGDQAKDAELIGQFGVGFYSSFIVADKVTVTTRRAGVPPEGGVRWESAGEGEYTIERLNVPRRGTEVTLHLREDQDEFLDGYRLRSIIRKYSDHILSPISMRREGEDETDEETVNTATALWARSKNEIEDSEYNEFYKHVAHDFEDPLAHVHSRVEGTLEYTTLLFVPSRAPFDIWDRNVRRGVKLYVRRVFIMDDAEQLMPPYLRFVRGVADSPDLPLNISREILQKNKQIDSIRGGCVKRVLDLLASIAKDDGEKYAKFWSEFGRVLKEGVIEDSKNREAVAKLLRFASTHAEGDEQTVTLDDYVGRMKEGQEHIYYITADSYSTAKNSPHLEIFAHKGVEVLLMSDDIDEWVVNHLTEYEGRALQSVSKGELDLSAIESVRAEEETGAAAEGEEASEKDASAHEALVASLKTSLADKVKDVRVTDRLVKSPACLVADEADMGAHLERLLKAAGQKVEGARPILEVNPGHPLVRRLSSLSDEDRRRDWAEILFAQAMLSEGGRLDDPADFVRRLNEMFIELAATPRTTRKSKARPRRATKKTPEPDGDPSAGKARTSSKSASADG